jgi:hypothetical protein
LLHHEDFGLNRPGRDDLSKGETNGTSISWVRYELVVSLAILMTLAGARLVTASEYTQGQSSAPSQLGVTATVTSTVTIIGPPGSTLSPSFTPTPLQDASSTTGAAANVSPPDKLDVENERWGAAGQWVRIPGWLLSVARGLLIWAVGGIILFSIVTLLFLGTRRRRLVLAPPPTASIPFLESPEGNLYFRLDKLDGDGLIIGRGKRGVDLRIEESNADADTVSNSHARIYYDATCGYVVIEDLDSTNGIYINGRRAPRKNLLKDGWVIGLGGVTLTYHDGESDTGPLD